ncbi:MAG TPA: HD domain-containing protein [Sediminispirochaeta sp.]|nr:HD domain-containing protein [Sediminispirochaeta sp.]
MSPISLLEEAGFASFLAGSSALELYFGQSGREPTKPVVWIETEGSLVDLSRLFDDLVFPGAEYFDAAVEAGGRLYMFHCLDGAPSGGNMTQAFRQGRFWYDLRRGVFVDPCGAYETVRDEVLQAAAVEGSSSPYAEIPEDTRRWYVVAEAAMLAANYGYRWDPDLVAPIGRRESAAVLSPVEQRFVLSAVVGGRHAPEGLQLLMDGGFVQAHWPLLAEMDEVRHSKEHHPEGNVWRHSLETFKHRKILEVPLSLALLLHDSGKAYARPRGGNRFDRHAQIGASKSRSFLGQLGFPQDVVDTVAFLVEYHMVPGLLSSLPVGRTEQVMSSPLFPDLLELYRCDVSSTFRGPEGYYQACRRYRSFLKHSRNPFRGSDGKKRLRLLVE